MIDVRSDTVTRPTPGMLQAMMAAEVGDDVFREDPTVNALQERVADLFGVEAALVFPSGTMSNQAGLRVHLRPGDEVICSEQAHIYVYEGGGVASNSGASVRLIRGDSGLFTAADVAANVNNRADAHLPWTALVSVENTSNRGGGVCWRLGEIEAIAEVCRANGLGLHLDGARLFNALAATGETARAYGRVFDTLSICLSKGLGAPAGSLLLGSKDAIARAYRYRKAFGGGMRQIGYLAAAGLYALDHNVARLSEDHARARALADALAELPYVARVAPAETNIVIAHLDVAAAALVEHMAACGVRAMAMGPKMARFVFHLEIDDAGLARIVEGVRSFRPAQAVAA
jgi:threonine aldolase